MRTCVCIGECAGVYDCVCCRVWVCIWMLYSGIVLQLLYVLA